MRISYAIPVCNELEEIQKLLDFLQQYIRQSDQLVIMIDDENGNNEVEDYVEDFLIVYKDRIDMRVIYHPLNNDFAAHKNFLNKCCTGDWIFQIDADELPAESLMINLPAILETNDNVDAIWVPRVNIVNGLTEEHVAKWGWTVNEEGWVNWPNDSQLRLYKNKPEIVWERKVHERLTGYKTISKLPVDGSFALWHVKDIARQERQNKFYEEI
jgi:glycosyltransferase involved in cell wall biosynthesis